jgi:SNF2 family DNA or RNA helicase
MRVFKPRDYQQALLSFALNELKAKGSIRVNWWSGMGTGKTGTTLELIATLLLFGHVKRVLIVGPKRVAASTWPDEVAQWANFKHLSCSVAVGGKKERLAAIYSGSDIVTVNFDVLPAFIAECGTFPFDMVVIDEATRLGSLRAATVTHPKSGKAFVRIGGGKQARAIAKHAFSKVNHWINLTGSPGGKGLEGIYGMTWPLDAGKRLGRSFTAYDQRFFRSFNDADGNLRREPFAHAQEEIQGLIRDITMVVEAKDFMELPPLVETVIKVKLPPAAMKLYKQFENEMFMEIAGNEIEAFNAGAVTNKCRQIANGSCIYDDTGQWELIHDAKIEALRECVEEAAGVPILVSYQYQADVKRILKAFPQAVRIDDNPETLRRFNRGEIEMLLAHPLSAGHGLNLQHACWNLVDFSTGWDFEADEQIVERIGPTRQAQSGYNRTVFRRRLIAAGTIEEVVLKRVKTRDSVQQLLREAMKKLDL